MARTGTELFPRRLTRSFQRTSRIKSSLSYVYVDSSTHARDLWVHNLLAVMRIIQFGVWLGYHEQHQCSIMYSIIYTYLYTAIPK